MEARSVFCYWSVRELLIKVTQIEKKLQMSKTGVDYAVKREVSIVKAKMFVIILCVGCADKLPCCSVLRQPNIQIAQ